MAYDDPRYRDDLGPPADPQTGLGGARRAGPMGGAGADGTESQPPYGAPAAGSGRGRGAGWLRRAPAAGGRRPAGTEPVRVRSGSKGGHERGGMHLGDVFDDPAHGEPGRDRMVVHLGWELILAVSVLVLGYLLRREDPGELRGDGLRDTLLLATVLGLATIGMALSLRAGAVNLAIGPVGYAAAQVFVQESDRGTVPAALLAIAVALGAGLVLAAVVVGLHVPSWAASLGLALAALAWIGPDRAVTDVVAGAYQPQPHASYWFAAMVAVSVLGGVAGLVKPIRRGTGRFRPVVDPARRRGVGGAVPAAAALVASTVLAAAAGVLLLLGAGRTGPAETGLTLTGLALGAALLGGTSAFGRRGGVAGTVLAVVGLVLLLRHSEVQGWRLSQLGVAAAAIAAGLAVTRLVERFGRPRGAGPYVAPPEPPRSASADPTGVADPYGVPESPWSSQAGSWAGPLSARTTESGWGEAERWPGR